MTETNETITRDAAGSRYVLTLDGAEVGRIDYVEADGVTDLQHTIVDEAYGGRGLAGHLARFALDDARERGLKVRPTCSYIENYLGKHPEYADLRA